MWELSFILNENIDWHCMQMELNLNQSSDLIEMN